MGELVSEGLVTSQTLWHSAAYCWTGSTGPLINVESEVNLLVNTRTLGEETERAEPSLTNGTE